jgi:hypothetical protein
MTAMARSMSYGGGRITWRLSPPAESLVQERVGHNLMLAVGLRPKSKPRGA